MGKFGNCQIAIVFFSLLLVIYGCASMQQPSGGPKDTKPPKVIKSTPKNLTTRFAAKEIKIEFDEFIKLNNEFTEISISPAIDKMPVFKARKQILDIKFEQALDSNTTYTINFGKAIADVNESNILRNYSYVFSTGDLIDSLSISGKVISTLTKDSLKDVTVFILPLKQDTLFGKKRANIFTSTDSAGNFILKNLREDDYLLYALKEESADRIYNSANEEIGFLTDTIHLDKNIEGVRVDVFKQYPDRFMVTDRKIENDGKVILKFNKPLPGASVDVLFPAELNSKKVVEITQKQDSALLWLPSLTFDSLKVTVSTNNKPVDTLQITRSKRDTYNRSVSVTDNLGSGKLKPGGTAILTLSSPIASFDVSKFTILEDSVSVTGIKLVKDTSSTRKYQMVYPWRAGKEYIIKASENAFTDVFANKSKVYTKTFSLDTEENYGTIALNIAVPEPGKNYLVEWINSEDVVLRTDKVTKDTVINYVKYPTAKYKVRIIYDANNNNVWDTGSVKDRRQPEKTWNFNKDLTLRPNWDLEEKLIIPKAQ